MAKLLVPVTLAFLVSAILLAACAPGASAPQPTVSPPAPTAAGAKPVATAAPAATTVAPTAAKAAPTAAKIDYPTKPITLNIPWPAGGTTDIGGRILSSAAEKILGQTITIVNKPGAAGQVGWAELALQKPDGYYIGMSNLPLLNTAILDPDRKATFQIDSFVPIMNQVIDPGVLFVKPDSPYKGMKDLVDDAKKRPEQIKCGTSGFLSDDHLAILQLEKAEGIKLAPVHFDGDVPKMTALLGGHIDVAWLNVGGFVAPVRSGQVRAIALLDKERSKFLPDVATSVQQGYPTVVNVVTRGIIGPKGVPDPIVKKLEDTFVKAAQSAEHVQKMEEAGYVVKIMGTEEYQKHWYEIHEQTKLVMPLALQAR